MARLQVKGRRTMKRGDSTTVTSSLRRRVNVFTGGACGFTLLELIITLTVMTILTLGIMPLVKVSVRRQREQRLRESLREMRLAIQEFHRDTIGMTCNKGPTVDTENQTRIPGGQSSADPRSRVVITDCTIFTVDNPDRFPPDLETLVKGVNISPRGGGPSPIRETATSGPIATEINEAASTKKKVYLRSIPIDPITGKAEWELRSSYDLSDAVSWGKENVFDVRSMAEGTSLSGEKYSDW